MSKAPENGSVTCKSWRLSLQNLFLSLTFLSMGLAVEVSLIRYMLLPPQLGNLNRVLIPWYAMPLGIAFFAAAGGALIGTRSAMLRGSFWGYTIVMALMYFTRCVLPR